ncbi:divergent polysaccharide deacetylase family protein [Thalassospira sp. TSL5-1]|uniref:divergent polysaccharide deacetylase family protein n=1 Tax=Thalassospira sp. TSL5-1 TaxID=1544451 RepID=UPI000A725FEE|nr:divergent polysaccharide deacetylase family protein [Thalassospira sp. TSL5-1]
MLGAAMVAGAVSAMIAAGSMLELDRAAHKAVSDLADKSTAPDVSAPSGRQKQPQMDFSKGYDAPNRPGYMVERPSDEMNNGQTEAIPQPRVNPLPNVTPSPTPLPVPDKGVVPGTQLAWQKFATHVPDTGNAPVIAIIIDDAGIDKPRTERAAELPAPITLSYLPYATHLPEQVATARKRGHEIMLHMPMEPTSRAVDPGPHALLTSYDKVAILNEMSWMLDRFSGYVGVNNHMGSKFTADPERMAVVMQVMKARGLMFLDSRTSAKSVGYQEAQKFDVPAIERDVFLDDADDAAKISLMLDRVESVARKRGYAVAIGHPRDLTLEALNKWIPKMQAAGFVFVPATDIIRRNGVKVTG